MTNKHRGEVPIYIGDKTYTLVYDWDAISKITNKYGFEVIQKITTAPDVKILAEIIEIGAHKHHAGQLKAKNIIEISPPVISMVNAVDLAISYSFYGPETVEQIESDLHAAQDEEKGKKSKKKT